MKITGHYPIEIERYLELEIREAAKPQPNLEIEHFLIRTFMNTDKMIAEFQAKSDAKIEEYKIKMEKLETLRMETEENKIKAADLHQNKPVLNPQRVKTMGLMGAAMDLFFSKKHK